LLVFQRRFGGEVEDDRRVSGVTLLPWFFVVFGVTFEIIFFYPFHASALRVRGRFRGSTSKGILPLEIKIYKIVIKK
jgi:hypothetical protein